MRILTTGSSGMVGSAVKEVFEEEGGYELTLTDIDTLDVRNYDNVMAAAETNPKLIIHLAAETDLEECEKNPGEAYLTNHTGTLNMMLLAKRLDIPIVYISTAGVFDGTKDGYNDWDEPCAINHYGRSKWFGEEALKGYAKAWIFRAGYMYGGGPGRDKKFVNKIYNQIEGGAKFIYALGDVIGSPTCAVDLARTIKNVIENKAPYGIYNSGGEGEATRFDVAFEIIKILDLQSKVVAMPVTGDYFKSDFPCPRSENEVLKNIKLNAMGLSKMRGWKDALREYIQTCYMD